MIILALKMNINLVLFIYFEETGNVNFRFFSFKSAPLVCTISFGICLEYNNNNNSKLNVKNIVKEVICIESRGFQIKSTMHTRRAKL